LQQSLHKHVDEGKVGLPDAFCKNALSTVPDLSCVVFRKRHGKNRETISIVKPQLIICPYFADSSSALTFRDFVPRLELLSPFRDFLGI